ncbi:MAG: amidohydrolase family protein, partial [Acidimicrobiales bacterium]|nr:amidohydrolase family protein [Acidimicrobiales bacterium]
EHLQTFRVGDYSIRVPYIGSVFMEVEKRIQEMDRLGIDIQMLSPNPLTFFGGIASNEADNFARLSNDAMANLVQKYPDRLLGTIALPMQDPEAACAELQRGVNELGLVGGYIGMDYGFTLDDPRLDDFYRTVVELDIPLFIHPATNDGIRSSADSRLGRFGLELVVGYTYEETLAVAALILGGVMNRHPKIDICVSHGGGAATFLAKRFDSWASFQGTESDFVSALRTLWYDSHLEPGDAHDYVVSVVGKDRMVYGTNFGGWDTPDETTEFDRSLGSNAERLLRLSPAKEES